MSFYNTPPSSYKPQVRVEGFHLPSPDTPSPGDANHHQNPHHHHRNSSEGGPGGSMVDDLFSTQSFAMPTSPAGDPFRKFPSSAGGGGDHSHHDFGDDLVSLMAADRSGPPAHHHQHHQQGSVGSSHSSAFDDYSATHHQHHPHQRTHNIFDVSSPIPMNGSAPGAPGNAAGGQQQPGSQPGSLHSPSTSLHDYHHHQHHPHHHTHHHFNSTLPALNSSMRFENPENNNPPPPPPVSSSVNNPLTPSSPHPPPSSYPTSTTNAGGNMPRHTPSPTIHAPGVPGAPPIPIVGGPTTGGAGRSRSRSRPPSQGGVGVSLPTNMSSHQLNSGGVGPARTTRQRRGNSISGTSPPPLGARPHAIVIPGRGAGGAGAGGPGAGAGPMSAGAAPGSAGGWFGANSTSEYSLPTPESLSSHSFSHSTGYTPFSLSPPPTNSSNASTTSNATAGNSNGGTTPTPSSTNNANNNNTGTGNNNGSPNNDLLPPLHHALSGSLHHHPHHHPAHHQHHQSFSSTASSSSYATTTTNNGYGGSGGSPPGMNGYHGHGHHMSLGSPMVASATTPFGGPSSNGLSAAMAANGVGVAGASAQGVGAGGVGAGPGGAGGAGGGGPVVAVVQQQDKQALLANEKRRRRRESHNAVERRRRDNINEKISELATLIPECMLDGSGPPNAKDPGTSSTPPITEDALVPHGPIPLPSDNADSPNSNGNAALKKEMKDDGESLLDGASGSQAANIVKANKGMILRKSVEYIRYLQQLVTAQGARNRELEGELRKYRGESPLSSTESSSANGSTANTNSMMSSEVNDDGATGGLTLVDDLDDLDDLDGVDPGPFGMGAFTMNVGVDAMAMMGIEGDASSSPTSGDPDAAQSKDSSSSSSATPTANPGKSTKKKSSNGGGGGSLERRKSQQHQRHSSSSGRLPSMPEEQELEDEETTTDDGSPIAQQVSAHSESTGLPSHFGQQQQDQQQQHHGMDVDGESTATSKMNGNGSDVEGGERGRTGTRGVRANGGPGVDAAFGNMHHHQMQQQQQQMNYQMGQAQVQMGW